VDTPYSTLQERLLETHTVSNFEKLELLFKTGQPGARKPSQLLNSMLEYCPQGEERGVFFHFMFLQRLPQSLRTLLGEVEHGDTRALAARADRLWACHGKQQQQEIAVVETEEEAEWPPSVDRGPLAGGRTRRRRRAASTRRASRSSRRPRARPG
jgi:hypothetical protein